MYFFKNLVHFSLADYEKLSLSFWQVILFEQIYSMNIHVIILEACAAKLMQGSQPPLKNMSPRISLRTPCLFL